MVGETYVLEVLKFKLHIPTLFDWANVYLQNAARFNPEKYKDADKVTQKVKVQTFFQFNPIFKRNLCKSLMAFLDLLVHDIKSLDFSYSTLAASVFYIMTDSDCTLIITVAEFLKNCTAYDVVQLEDCINWVSTFQPFYEFEVLDKSKTQITKKKDWHYLLQIYNPTILPGLVEYHFNF